MQRHTGERGAALILLLGIAAALAILAATLVVVLANQQGATASERQHTKSVYYSDAALSDVVRAATAQSISHTSDWLTLTDTDLLNSLIAAGFPSISGPHGGTVTHRVYDNQVPVNYTISYDQGSPASASTPDGMVWLEVTVTYQGKSTRMRVLVTQTQACVVSAFPRAALYCDTGIQLLGTSDVYVVNPDGSNDTSGPPFATAVAAGGNYQSGQPNSAGTFASNSSSDLAGPGTSIQSIGIKATKAVSTPGHTFADVHTGAGTVGILSDYFDQGSQADLGNEAQAGSTIRANASGTSVAVSKFSQANILTISGASYNSGTKTYTFANDLVVTGSLTLQSGTGTGAGVFPSGTTFNFKSLYLNGTNDLTLTGQVTVNTTALYVGDALTISGATSAVVDHFGPIYVAGIVTVSGTASVKTTDYTKANADPPDSGSVDATNNPPSPMWVARLHLSGTYDDLFGPTWVNGGADTNNTVSFDGPNSGNPSVVMCPLLATTEQTTSSHRVNFGTRARPMVYYMQCDNDGGYVNTCDWGSTGTFYGLMVLMEARIEISGGAVPAVEGAVFCGAPYTNSYTDPHGDIDDGCDITLTGSSTVAYNQAVIDAVSNGSITTTTTVTTVVPGSWQQLSTN